MTEEQKPRRSRRQPEMTPQEMTDEQFIAVADKFINLANRQNRTIKATDLHMVFLYAAARYNAHVAKNVLELEEHEPFVDEMMKAYQEMLRIHFSDPKL